ncbi:hypothetical protein [Natronoglomus mannanivorans]|uniref:Uncharacterized protein n=1 Tax=Natronoglomus mannanivorans TaxID=2979990 RepID=A0AAP3E2W7_9EURY|nr:hypothetical protein [Halobacteria archaeon AArc-xg1-1]
MTVPDDREYDERERQEYARDGGTVVTSGRDCSDDHRRDGGECHELDACELEEDDLEQRGVSRRLLAVTPHERRRSSPFVRESPDSGTDPEDAQERCQKHATWRQRGEGSVSKCEYASGEEYRPADHAETHDEGVTDPDGTRRMKRITPRNRLCRSEWIHQHASYPDETRQHSKDERW